MNEFFQIIGSIASLISIPLAIYLYLKSREAKFDRLKKEIVKILSYQIGDERQVTTFEIKTVINSKLRENRIKTDSISVSEVTEDLVAEVIASPLINKDRKTEILLELRKIHLEGELFDEIDSIEDDTEITWENIEPKFKSIVEHRKVLDQKLSELKEKNDRYRERFSSVFALTVAVLTIVTAFIGFIGEDKLKEFVTPIDESLKQYEFIVAIFSGLVTSILAGLMTALLRKKKKK
ncbi:MAG: hypothetical protein RIG62_16825 [Cyclobacteriaceae bacterium]